MWMPDTSIYMAGHCLIHKGAGVNAFEFDPGRI